MNTAAFACGSNGGAPRAPLKGWSDFKRCPADAAGLHEVYFEYDDEIEYIARAHDDDREISRWAGTHEVTYPVVTSALFDDAGILKGIRLVTDPRPEHRNDITEADRKSRDDFYVLGGVMAARFNIEAGRDCKSLPPAEGESAVGGLFIKQVCERRDPAAGPPHCDQDRSLPQTGTECLQSATADPIDPGPVREFREGRGLPARRPLSATEAMVGPLT